MIARDYAIFLLSVLMLMVDLTHSFYLQSLKRAFRSPSVNIVNSDLSTFIDASSEKVQRINTSPTTQSDKKTFRRFIQTELYRTSELEKLFPILCAIESACRDISKLMRRIATDSLSGNHQLLASGSDHVFNIQGETQKKLDVIANRILKTALCCTGEVSIIASEEEDIPCSCSTVTDNGAFSNGEYAVVFDPLDGSSNIDSGLPTGTIFGIYRQPRYGPKDPLTTSTQKGSELVASGYCLYSASTHFVFTMKQGVHMFTCDDLSDEFYLTRSHVQIPSSGPIYSFNDVYSSDWDPAILQYYQDLKRGIFTISPSRSSDNNNDPVPRSSRYFGALVADIHNILFHGGIYGYPGTRCKPQGKLRLLYEANPIALLIEQANGLATNGLSRILDLSIEEVHDRTPLFVGSREEMIHLLHYLNFNQSV